MHALKSLYYRFVAWLEKYEIVFCAECVEPKFRKDVTYEWHRVGGMRPLCQRCHRRIYEPWSNEK